MKPALTKGIALAFATEIAADTAVIGGVLAARGKAPFGLVAVAGCLAVAGLATLARMLPAIEREAVELAAEQGLIGSCDEAACSCQPA